MNNFYTVIEPELSEVKKIIMRDEFTKNDLVKLLSVKSKEGLEYIQKRAYEVKKEKVGAVTYFRGLVEYSNICSKDCYYCGIRKSNGKVGRYIMKDEEVYEAIDSAYKYGYGSLVIQAGERTDEAFIEKMILFLKYAKKKSENALGITLSIGEQSEEVYKQLKEAGAHRFLLRIETSSKKLYKEIHPKDHSFTERLACLKTLQKLGYQTGSGVMIGLPGQTISDLADDLLFLKEFDIDMVGMGPFLEHEETPMFQNKDDLLPRTERLELALKMISILRLLMKDINIASATALQAINPIGREMGLKAGANVIMPNLTPVHYREGYQLYENKPCIDEEASKCRGCLENRIKSIGDEIGFNEWGDSKHYFKRVKD